MPPRKGTDMACGAFCGKWIWLRKQKAFQRRPLRIIWRFLIWRIHSLFKGSRTVYFRQWGVNMRLPPQWRGTAKLLYMFREDYEPELEFLATYLKPSMVFVDIGANFGIYSLRAASLLGPSGRVLAFEPAAFAYQVLQENLRLNRYANAIPIQLALADKAG